MINKAKLQGFILLFKIHMTTQKNFSTHYPQFRHTLSNRFTGPGLHIDANSIKQNSHPCFAFSQSLLSTDLSKINFHFVLAITKHSVAYFSWHVLANKFSIFKNYQKSTTLLHIEWYVLTTNSYTCAKIQYSAFS